MNGIFVEVSSVVPSPRAMSDMGTSLLTTVIGKATRPDDSPRLTAVNHGGDCGRRNVTTYL